MEKLLAHLRIALTASAVFANFATAFTTFFLVPAVSLVIIVFATFGVKGNIAVDTLYAGIVVALGVTVMLGVVEGVTYDRNLGILSFVLNNSFFSPLYWLGKILVPFLIGVTTAFVGLAAVYYFVDSSATKTTKLLLVIYFAFIMCVAAGFLGLAASLLSIGTNNPYLISNFFSATAMLLTGVVVPLAAYPEWLQKVCVFLPFTNAVTGIRGESLAAATMKELAVLALWVSVALLLTKVVLKRFKSGKIRELLW